MNSILLIINAEMPDKKQTTKTLIKLYLDSATQN
jgi:hypothetical protein